MNNGETHQSFLETGVACHHGCVLAEMRRLAEEIERLREAIQRLVHSCERNWTEYEVAMAEMRKIAREGK